MLLRKSKIGVCDRHMHAHTTFCAMPYAKNVQNYPLPKVQIQREHSYTKVSQNC